MSFRRRLSALALATVFAVAGTPAFGAADKSKDDKTKSDGKPMLWREPADIASLNLLWGPGGESMKPDLSKITFIREEPGGYSKKYRVTDGAGRTWVAKIGNEAQSETASTRLLWAAGYFTDITYLVPTVTIEGKGTFENVRFEARGDEDAKRLDNWKWDRNPFSGTLELQGLKVMMVMLDNWDIKDVNNRIVRVRNQETGEYELRYVVSDLGGTLGKTGLFAMSRSRNTPADFAKAKFIDEIKGDRVDFHFSGKRKDLFRNITVEQARWLGQLLSKLSDEQLADAFRSANYTSEEVAMLAATVRSRINELVALPQTQPAAASITR